MALVDDKGQKPSWNSLSLVQRTQIMKHREIAGGPDRGRNRVEPESSDVKWQKEHPTGNWDDLPVELHQQIIGEYVNNLTSDPSDRSIEANLTGLLSVCPGMKHEALPLLKSELANLKLRGDMATKEAWDRVQAEKRMFAALNPNTSAPGSESDRFHKKIEASMARVSEQAVERDHKSLAIKRTVRIFEKTIAKLEGVEVSHVTLSWLAC